LPCREEIIQVTVDILEDLLFTPRLFTTNVNENRNWLFTGETVSFYNRWDNALTLDIGVK